MLEGTSVLRPYAVLLSTVCVPGGTPFVCPQGFALLGLVICSVGAVPSGNLS